MVIMRKTRLGGNGRGARHADAVGQLTADLALNGEWQSSLPRDVFRPVPAGSGWTGMPLLWEQRREAGMPACHGVGAALPAAAGACPSRPATGRSAADSPARSACPLG